MLYVTLYLQWLKKLSRDGDFQHFQELRYCLIYLEILVSYMYVSEFQFWYISVRLEMFKVWKNLMPSFLNAMVKYLKKIMVKKCILHRYFPWHLIFLGRLSIKSTKLKDVICFRRSTILIGCCLLKYITAMTVLRKAQWFFNTFLH